MSTSSSARRRRVRPANGFGAALLVAAAGVLHPGSVAARYDATHKSDQDLLDAVGGAAAIHPATQIGSRALVDGGADLRARRGIK